MLRRAILQRVIILVLLAAIIEDHRIFAQVDRAKLAPELAPLAAKYDSEIAALTRTRDQAVEFASKPFLSGLDAAAQKATSAGRSDEADALLAEKEAVTGGQIIPATPSPLIPQQLIKTRNAYLREQARIQRAHEQQLQQPTANYLRTLAFLETKARTNKQADLLEQIRLEKLRIGNHQSGNSGPIENTLVVNGDFAKKDANGIPEKWSVTGPGKAAATTEDGVPFVRLASGSKTETWLRQQIKRPPGSKELRVQVRLRCRDIRSGGYGLIIVQLDSAGTSHGGQEVCWTDLRLTSWKDLRGVIALHPDTAEIIVRCNIKDAVATVDFADLRIAAR